MATVDYRHIAKNFGAIEVIRDLSLYVDDGEFGVLLGESGCGKTTLLRMTAGLETISGGDLFIDDKRVNDVHPRDRNIAMVFQNYALYPTMKVFENIAFSLEINKVSPAEIKRKVHEAAEVLNITDYLDRYPRELSGGQRQRVAMGRAMVRNAEVFLFDEPLSNLDAKLRAHMRVEIRLLHDRLGTTTVYVTHDQIEAMTMADKIVLMKDGQIEQVGTPDELYDKPGSLFAADFIGTPTMNFVEGKVESLDGKLSFVANGVSLALPKDCKAKPRSAVTCGIRPTDLVIKPGGAVRAELTMVEKTGADLNLHVRLGERDMVATAPRHVSATPGKEIAFDVDSNKLHVFDTETGIRI